MNYSGESRSESGNSIHSLLKDPYKDKVDDAVDMVNKLVINDKNFIRNTPAEFRSQVRELKETQDFAEDASKDEILDDLLRLYLTPEYEKMIRQKLNQKPASPVTPPKRKRQVSLREMTVIVGKNKKSKKSKKKSKRNNKRKPSKKK